MFRRTFFVGCRSACRMGYLFALVIGAIGVSSALAGERPADPQAKKTRKMGLLSRFHKEPTSGTLGYGPPGLHPGFQGFGMGYHLGNGYGGDGLGVGAEGGFPFYGGPGYRHPGPRLSRHLAIVPFGYYGGPGGPRPACPQYYGGVGPLAVDRPVISVAGTPGEAGYDSGFGGFTGAVPNAEAAFAPFTSQAGGGRSFVEYTPAPSPSRPAPSPALPEGIAPPSASLPPTSDLRVGPGGR